MKASVVNCETSSKCTTFAMKETNAYINLDINKYTNDQDFMKMDLV